MDVFRCGLCNYAVAIEDLAIQSKTFPKQSEGDRPSSAVYGIHDQFHHADCYRLFRQECHLSVELRMELMSALTNWRRPWPGAPRVGLDATTITSLPVPELTDRCQLPQLLKRLPAELVARIQLYSIECMVWRYALVRSIARQSFSEDDLKMVSIPLRDIIAWERGNKPRLRTAGEVVPEWIRLTIDSFGVNKLERLDSAPAFRASQRTRFIYAVFEQSEVPVDGQMRFKFGLAFIPCLWSKDPRIPCWDTPTPPPLDDCVPNMRLPASGDEGPHAPYFFSTAEVSETRGITFFVGSTEITRLHIHTNSSPTATESESRHRLDRRWKGVWMYVPTPPKDPIVAIGALWQGGSVAPSPVDSADGFVMRRKLSGNIYILNPPHPGSRAGNPEKSWRVEWSIFPDVLLSRFDVDGYSWEDAYTVLGGFTAGVREAAHGATLAGGLRLETGNPLERLLVDPHDAFNCVGSKASLEGIVRLQILEFDRASRHQFRGMLMEYNDGSQQSVGEFRVGWERMTVCFNPTWIRFWGHRVDRMVHPSARGDQEIPDGLMSVHGAAAGQCNCGGGGVDVDVDPDKTARCRDDHGADQCDPKAGYSFYWTKGMNKQLEVWVSPERVWALMS